MYLKKIKNKKKKIFVTDYREKNNLTLNTIILKVGSK